MIKSESANVKSTGGGKSNKRKKGKKLNVGKSVTFLSKTATEQSSISTHYQKFIDILGKKYTGESIESPYDFINVASKGVDAGVITKFSTYFDVSKEDTAEMLNISTPTLYRWIKSNKSLERNYSVIIFELTDLFIKGSEIFSSNENFMKWLSLPNTALGGLEPQEIIEFPEGISKVKGILGRIEHGIYS